tara:strand:- start:249 stop:617 length:369 start_codon:yes stop_codon:yes gene_type:complete
MYNFGFSPEQIKEERPKLYKQLVNGFRLKYTGDKLIDLENLNPETGFPREYLYESKDESEYQYFSLSETITIQDAKVLLKVSHKFHPIYKDITVIVEYLDGWNESLGVQKIQETSGKCEEVT